MSRDNLTWIAETDWSRMGKLIFVKCPGCGEKYRLEHEVDRFGVVSPSLDCPTCPFHEYVRLIGWIESTDRKKITHPQGDQDG